tara:strand:- start:160 stop:399 length:240 start_codon:yes stop_codon:yes gene_type:complete
MSKKQYKIKTEIATFEIKMEPLGLWDLWVNSMPTLTFASPEEAAYAVIQKKTGYSLWDNQEKKISNDLKIERWEEIADD